MSYAKIQFIGYKIFTAPKNVKWDRDPDEAGARICDGTYIGPANHDQDLRTRCQLMKKAVEAAREKLGEEDDQTLKVFLAPEFFFRTREGGYQLGIANEGADKLKRALLRMVRAKKWNHWLFVFGSAVGYRSRPGAGFYNLALVVRGGAGTAGDLSFERALRTSRLQPLPTAAVPAGGGTEPPPQRCFDERGLFEVEGITFGLEMGRDHEVRQDRQGPASPLPGGRLPQIILAPACGPGAPACRPPRGGYLFCADGWKPGCFLFSGSDAPEGEVEQVRDQVTTVHLDAADIEVDSIFSGKPGKVMIYPPHDIPEERTVPGVYRDMAYATQDGNYTFALKCVYNEAGSLRETLCAITNKRTGAVTPNFYLPLAVDLDDEKFPLRARLEARYAPWNEEGQDMVIFADLTYRGSAVKGAVLPFSGRVPVTPSKDEENADAPALAQRA